MKKAFTLIELLVVIAIIAILAALLLPVLGNAKRTSKQSLCINNLKQLIMAVHMYADDYSDFIPCMRMEDTLGNPHPVPADYPSNWAFSWAVQAWPYLKSRAVWICPDSGNTETGINYYPQFGHYGGSSPTVFNWPASYNPPFPPQPNKRSSIPNPSGKYAIFDSGAYWCSQAEALLTSNPYGSYIPGEPWNTVNSFGGNAGDIGRRRHPSGVCVAFLDGHVETVDVVKLANNTAGW